MLNLGKLFIKDFVDELEMQEILLDEEEIEKISAFADAEGQVLYFCTFFCSYDFKNQFVDMTNNIFHFVNRFFNFDQLETYMKSIYKEI